MARASNVELIRSIGSIVGDVSGMLQATPQELQAARIAADETSQTRTMEFQEEMKEVDFQNRMLADEVQRRGDEFEDNAKLINAAKLDMANRGVNYEAFVADGGVTEKQNSLVNVINRKYDNALGISEMQLQKQNDELSHMINVLGHDTQLQNEARGVFDMARVLEEGGDDFTISKEEWELAGDKLTGDEYGYTAEDVERLKTLMAPQYDAQMQRFGEQLDRSKTVAEKEGIKSRTELTKVQTEKLRDEIDAKAKLDEFRKAGYKTEEEKSEYFVSNIDAIAQSVTLNDEDDQKEFNTVLGQIKEINRKGIDPSLASDAIESKLDILITGKDWGSTGWNDAILNEFLASDNPDEFLLEKKLDFNGRDGKSDPKNQRYDAIIKLHSLNRILDKTQEVGLADGSIELNLEGMGDADVETTVVEDIIPAKVDSSEEVVVSDELRVEIRAMDSEISSIRSSIEGLKRSRSQRGIGDLYKREKKLKLARKAKNEILKSMTKKESRKVARRKQKQAQ